MTMERRSDRNFSASSRKRQACGDAPGVQWDSELRGDLQQQLFDALLFGRLYSDDGVVRIDEKA